MHSWLLNKLKIILDGIAKVNYYLHIVKIFSSSTSTKTRYFLFQSKSPDRQILIQMENQKRSCNIVLWILWVFLYIDNEYVTFTLRLSHIHLEIGGVTRLTYKVIVHVYVQKYTHVSNNSYTYWYKYYYQSLRFPHSVEMRKWVVWIQLV